MATRELISPIPDTNQHPMQSVHGLSVKNQENLQCQHQSEFGRLHDAHNPVNILALPTELLYDALDYLSTEDLVSFAFCQWDLFQALVGFLECKARPSLQGLALLVTLSEQPILRDIGTLVDLFEDSHWPKEQLRDIFLVSARRDQPTVHSCVELGFEEVACRYLRKSPHGLFDTNILHMTALHISALKRAGDVVQEIGSIAQNMSEFHRVEFINQRDNIQNTSLDYAITTSSSTIVDMLISAGARINDTDFLGYTPLMNACRLGRDEIVHCLADRGADIQATKELQPLCFGKHNDWYLRERLYDAERNEHLKSTTQGPAEASTPLSRHQSSPSIASDLTSREPDFLADLSPMIPSEAGTDGGEIVDGFGTFRRSTIFIFRYGPDYAAKFSAKYTDGHGVNDRRDISNFDVRITQLRDSNDRGKYWRYSKENVIGICGVAFEERKFPDRVYKLRRTVWAKIKWRNIATVGKGLFQGDYPWIPRDDFAR
ncbi:unnamed protein product, partial [Penicillium nalgiovense]